MFPQEVTNSEHSNTDFNRSLLAKTEMRKQSKILRHSISTLFNFSMDKVTLGQYISCLHSDTRPHTWSVLQYKE